MAYPTPFYRLQVSGTGYQGEIWSWSLALQRNFEHPDEPPILDEVPAAVVTAVETFHKSTGAKIASLARLTTIKLNLVGEDGRYVSESTTFHDFPPPGVAGSAAATPPAQLSLAVSLTTNASRGLASSGRFYIPYAAHTVASPTTGLLHADDVMATANAAVTLLNALNSGFPYGDVVVASKVGAGKFRPVTGVRVGRVMDTQRRRRNALREEHVTATSEVALTP